MTLVDGFRIHVSGAHIGGRVPKRLRGLDQREVREGLRKVPDQPLLGDVVLLGEQPQVVAERQQTLEQLASLVRAPVHRERRDEPERAGQELRLAAG
jgi:hypothetical protein